MRVVILTEGGGKKGFGHISRCIAISQGFNEKEIIPEVYINGDKSIDRILRGIKYVKFNWFKDKTKTLGLIENTDILIIDSYFIDEAYCKLLAEKVKTPVFIDDYNRINYPEGIVLNGSIGAKKIRYSQNNKIKYLLGTEYQPLRKEFWNAKPVKIKKKIKNILITMGGNDVRNLTPQILEQAIKIFPNENKNVIVTKSYKNIHRIEAQKDGKTIILKDINAKRLIELYKGTDIAVSAAGQTIYELAAFGIPSIIIQTTDNQKNNLTGWTDYNSCIYKEHSVRTLVQKLSIIFLKLKTYSIRRKLSNNLNNCIFERSTKCLIERIINFFENTISYK